MDQEVRERIRDEIEFLFECDISSKESKREENLIEPAKFSQRMRERLWEQHLLHYFNSISDWEQDVEGNNIEHIITGTNLRAEDVVQWLKEETIYIRIRDDA